MDKAGARDVWFVAALPANRSAQLGWGFKAVGGFLATWVIEYRRTRRTCCPHARAERAQAVGA